MSKSITPVICAKQLSKSYQDGQNEISVLKALDFSIYPADLIAILGPSGSGKSTLLHLLGGLDQPTSGEVLWESVNINQVSEHQRCLLRGKKLGFVYQFHHLLPEFTALENVMMPALIVGTDVNTAKEKAAHCLEQVGLQHRLTHKPSALSGGERQRTAIARALINDPLCVLADEPTGNLDRDSALRFYELILSLNQKQKTAFVIVTHDQAATHHMQQVYFMGDGRLSQQTTTQQSARSAV